MSNNKIDRCIRESGYEDDYLSYHYYADQLPAALRKKLTAKETAAVILCMSSCYHSGLLDGYQSSVVAKSKSV